MRAGWIIVLTSACSFQAPVSTATDALPQVDDAGPDAAIDAPSPTASCPASYELIHGTSRYRLGTAATWTAAQEACEADGGHLVVIDDSAENAFVIGLQPTGDLWIGMSDHLAEGTFVWVSGAPLSAGHQSWQVVPAPQPNDGGGSEDCGELNVTGVWNDNTCDAVQNYVCECDGITPAAPTWCTTGTDRSCDSCEDRCDQRFDGDGECRASDQSCREGE
jgi:hypothetical protein